MHSEFLLIVLFSQLTEMMIYHKIDLLLESEIEILFAHSLQVILFKEVM